MTDEAATPSRTPWHLWLVGVVSLLWSALGAFDYLMTQTENQAYIGQFTPEQLEFFYGFPTWVVFFWAIAVWGGVAGAVLLLLRKRAAAAVFAASFLSMVVTSFHNFVLADGMAIMGSAGMVFSALIFVLALGFWLYARAMAKNGVLS